MIIYLLEEVYYVGTDSKDNERAEYRLVDGFWANARKLSAAKKRIRSSLGEGWEIVETPISLDVSKKQKYIYVLNHEYSLADGTCFYYQFEPQTSINKCRKQKKELEKSSKFKKRRERLYDSKNNGWFIEKYEIVF